ncbi:MAG: Trm112 family protein [Candidatus Nanoarchaeia archaeon]
MTKPLPRELLQLICCPVDKCDLIYDKKKQTLTCKKCKFVYSIKNGIPLLLPPEMQK